MDKLTDSFRLLANDMDRLRRALANARRPMPCGHPLGTDEVVKVLAERDALSAKLAEVRRLRDESCN